MIGSGLSLLSSPAQPDTLVNTLSLPCRVFLAALSGVLLCLPWLNPALYWTAWIGWVPLLFALENTRLPVAALLGWVTGVVCFAGASNWMVAFIVNLKGLSYPLSAALALIFWCYAGIAIGIACAGYRWLIRWLPGYQVVAFPVCVLSSMALYPLLFETHFAEAQAQFLSAIQGVALLGAQGLDAVMAVVSVLIFLLVRHRTVRCLWHPLNLSALVLMLAWFTYGVASLASWDNEIAHWESRAIGLVQPNDAVSLEIPTPAEGFSHEFPEEMLATRRLSEAGAEWVAWPEARYKGYFDKFSVREGYRERLQETGVSLIFHDVEKRWQDSEQVSFNSVVMLDEQGNLQNTYRKIQRMPFGEYLPDVFSLPGLDSLSTLFLGEFLRPLAAGTDHAYFQIGDMRVVPKVCFETAFPAFIADSIGTDGAGKILLFLSQDSWFGETTQPFQHGAMSIIRGVENRVPMIHLINNGPSLATTPHGRVIGATDAFSRAEVLVSMPFSKVSGGSFFSRYPWLSTWMTFLIVGILFSLSLLRLCRYRMRLLQTTSPAVNPDDQAH